jgi:hypothetical protein
MISYLLHEMRIYGNTIGDDVVRAEYFAKFEQLIDIIRGKYEELSPRPAPEPVDDWW